MSTGNILVELEKIKYQLRTLAKTVDYDAHPVEALILSMDWSEGDINRAHDIFEKYDKKLGDGEEVSWHVFECELKDEFQIGYQTVKSIVLAFYKNHQWTNVCHGYAMSFEPSTPVEFHQITRREKKL